MSGRNEKYQEKMKASLAGKVPAEVLAVGVFSRPGSMGNVVASQLSGLAYLLGNQSSKGRAGGLPQNVVFAVTAEHVYVFAYKPKGMGGLKVKDPIVVWPRGSVRFSLAGSGALADTYHVEIAGQEPIQLDSNKLPGMSSDFNDPALSLLQGS